MGERFAGRTCVRRDSSEEGRAFARCARGGFCSDSTALFGPSRCCWVIFGRMGIRLWRRRGWPERLEPYWGGGSSLVGTDLRSQRFFGRRKSFRAAREGWGCSDSTALSGPSRGRSVLCQRRSGRSKGTLSVWNPWFCRGGVRFSDERQCSFFLLMFAKCVQCPTDCIRIHCDNKQAEGGSMSF